VRPTWSNAQEAVIAAIRLALVTGAFALTVVSESYDRLASSFPWLLGIAIAASLPLPQLHKPWVATLEAIGVVLLATFPDPAAGPLLVYWLAPGLAAGLRGDLESGRRGTAIWSAVTALVPWVVGALMIQREVAGFERQSLITLTQWALLALGVGLLASWQRRLSGAATDAATQAYTEAVRVLTELEEISQRLPTGLDVGSIGEQMLHSIRSIVPSRRTVIATTQSGVLASVAAWPEDDADWLPFHEVTEPWLEAPERHWFEAVEPDTRILVVPLRVAERVVGCALIDDPAPLSREDEKALMRVVDRDAVALQAALLFDTVRSVATTEERNRVAREVHDGIAQDVAFLGYLADEIADLAPAGRVRGLAEEMRSEISRVLGEVRMSIHAWRGRFSVETTLGGSIADFARHAFRDSDVNLHITLDESASRLRPLVEAEVLRISQEALTNARRHSDARNVWVECRVKGSSVEVAVTDDGTGIAARRPFGYGLEIMHERARGIGAHLDVGARPGGGTVVTIQL